MSQSVNHRQYFSVGKYCYYYITTVRRIFLNCFYLGAMALFNFSFNFRFLEDSSPAAAPAPT